MRVFHLVKGLGRGGAETLLVRTALTLPGSSRRNGYGYFLPWKDALVPEIQARGCLVRCFSARNPAEMLVRLPELVWYLKKWQPDLIHCHLPLAGVIGRLAGKLLNVPVIYTEHNLQERYHPLTRLANRLTWTMQDRVIAVSQEVKESILKSMPANTGVHTVLNGVDCSKFIPLPSARSEIRSQLGLAESDFLVGTVAVFRKQKRLDLWLEVAQRFLLEAPNAHFVLVGDGPERPVVEELIARYNLTSRVILPGLKGEVLPFFCAMDAFLMSSDFEGLPVALLEAMACQTPAVATRAGGIGEVIVEPSQGLLAEKGDVPKLLEHLQNLYHDPELRSRVGENGRRRVEQAFSLDKMNTEIEHLYGQVTRRVQRDLPKAPDSLPGYAVEKSTQPEEALGLIKTSLGPGSQRAPRTLDFYIWKHLESPFGESYSLAVREEQGSELAGLRLFQRWSLIRDFETTRAVRAVDTCTHPTHQRRGIFTFLTRNALEDLATQGVQLVFNTPNKNSLPGYLKMGWELVRQIPIRIKFLSVSGGAKVSWGGRSLKELLQQHSAEEIDHLIAQTRVPGNLQIEKSLEYLKWRYLRHPNVDYRFAFGMTGSRMDSLVVSCQTSRYGLREVAVCELFALKVESGEALVRDVLLGSGGHYAVSAFSGSPTVDKVMQNLGFRAAPGKTIDLTVNPLRGDVSSIAGIFDWNLSTGDLQVF